MLTTLKNWYNCEDIKYHYRLNKISIEEATINVNKRVLIVLTFSALVIILSLLTI